MKNKLEYLFDQHEMSIENGLNLLSGNQYRIRIFLQGMWQYFHGKTLDEVVEKTYKAVQTTCKGMSHE